MPETTTSFEKDRSTSAPPSSTEIQTETETEGAVDEMVAGLLIETGVGEQMVRVSEGKWEPWASDMLIGDHRG